MKTWKKCDGCTLISPSGDKCTVTGFEFLEAADEERAAYKKKCQRAGWRLDNNYTAQLHSPSTGDWAYYLDEV